jgi:hypothetical protein
LAKQTDSLELFDKNEKKRKKQWNNGTETTGKARLEFKL